MRAMSVLRGFSPSIRIHRRLVAVFLVGLVIGTAAGVLIFTQTFPTVPVLSLSPNCTTLVADSNAVVAGSSGFKIFSCGAANLTAAFHAEAGVTAVPTFTLPSPYTSLWLFSTNHQLPQTGQGCQSAQNDVQLYSGGTMTFATAFDAAYCVEFQGASAGGLPTFSISWNVS